MNILYFIVWLWVGSHPINSCIICKWIHVYIYIYIYLFMYMYRHNDDIMPFFVINSAFYVMLIVGWWFKIDYFNQNHLGWGSSSNSLFVVASWKHQALYLWFNQNCRILLRQRMGGIVADQYDAKQVFIAMYTVETPRLGF